MYYTGKIPLIYYMGKIPLISIDNSGWGHSKQFPLTD